MNRAEWRLRRNRIRLGDERVLPALVIAGGALIAASGLGLSSFWMSLLLLLTLALTVMAKERRAPRSTHQIDALEPTLRTGDRAASAGQLSVSSTAGATSLVEDQFSTGKPPPPHSVHEPS